MCEVGKVIFFFYGIGNARLGGLVRERQIFGHVYQRARIGDIPLSDHHVDNLAGFDVFKYQLQDRLAQLGDCGDNGHSSGCLYIAIFPGH